MGKSILSGCDKHLCRLRNIFILVVKATTLKYVGNVRKLLKCAILIMMPMCTFLKQF